MREVGHECGSAVTNHFLWKSMVMPDMLQEQPGDSCGVQGGDCGDGVNLLGQAIHHHEDGIVSLGVREFSDHVYGDHLPGTLLGISFPTFCIGKVFVRLCVASCDELGDVPGQPWPPVVP